MIGARWVRSTPEQQLDHFDPLLCAQCISLTVVGCLALLSTQRTRYNFPGVSRLPTDSMYRREFVALAALQYSQTYEILTGGTYRVDLATAKMVSVVNC